MSDVAVTEGVDLWAEQGHFVDGMCRKFFPFCQSEQDFIDAHDQEGVFDQNREGQMRKLLVMATLPLSDSVILPMWCSDVWT
ncbi:MAG: hypothetical protein JKY94_13060 [Rhodobacteraceae bacterium]|nr:hypothetical protein [Paracoccaceae bacterium]